MLRTVGFETVPVLYGNPIQCLHGLRVNDWELGFEVASLIPRYQKLKGYIGLYRVWGLGSPAIHFFLFCWGWILGSPYQAANMGLFE